MGYDCTLHVIDPGSIDRFVDHFLRRGGGGQTAFDRAYDVPAMYARVRDAIARDPEQGARGLLQAALLFSSTESPHLPSRGFALGLWDRFVDEPLPAAAQSPISLRAALAPIVQAYPAIGPHLFTGIVGNHEVGHYVPPGGVPQLLQHVEGVVARMPPSKQPTFGPLLRVLRVARDRGLAYWEAADLAVSSAHDSWIPPEQAAPPVDQGVAARIRIELDMASMVVAVGDSLLFTHPLGSVVVDAAQARVTHRIEQRFRKGAVTRSGHVVVTTEEHRLLSVDLERGTTRELPRVDDAMIGQIRAVGEAILVAPPFYVDGPLHGRGPAWFRDGALVAIDVPMPDPSERVRWSQVSSFDAIELDGGAWLLLWGHRLFFVDAQDAVTALPITGVKSTGTEMPTRQVRDAEGGVYWVDDGTLVRLTASTRQVVVEALDDVTALRAGPGRVLVLTLLDNPEGDVMRIVWLDERRITRVSSAQLGFSEPVRDSAFMPAAKALAVVRWADAVTEVRLVPWSEIEALPRCSFEEIAGLRAAKTAEAHAGARQDIVARIDAATERTRLDEPHFLALDVVVVDPERGAGLVTESKLLDEDCEVTFRDGTVARVPKFRA